MKRKKTRSRIGQPHEPHAPQSAPGIGNQPGSKLPAHQFPSGLIIGGIVLLTGVLVWVASNPFRAKKPSQFAIDSKIAAIPASATLTQPSNTVVASKLAPEVSQTNQTENVLVDRINRANQFLANGKPAEAVDLLQLAQQANPDDEDIQYNLGIALTKLGRYPEALKAYEEALRIFPDYAEAHNNLGNLLLRLGRQDDALKHFDQSIKIAPDYAAGWNNYGNALQQVGRTNEARDHFQKAVGLDTNYWEAHYNLGTSFLRERRFPEARTEFDTVLRLQPNFVPAKASLARIDAETTPGPVQP